MTPLAWLGILAILLVIEAITVGLPLSGLQAVLLWRALSRGLEGELLYTLFLFFGVSRWCF